MRPTLPLVLLVLLSGCTAGTTEEAAVSAPSGAVTAPAGRSLLVAVERGTRPGLWLYRVGDDRAATHVATVPPPVRGASVRGFTLSAGPSPDVCATWVSESEESVVLRCGSWGDLAGAQVPTQHEPADVSLRADGARLAWTEDSRDPETYLQELVVASYRHGEVSGAQRYVTSGTGPEGRLAVDCGEQVFQPVWAGEDALLGEGPGMNDLPGFQYRIELGERRPTCTQVPEPDHAGRDGRYFTSPSWSDGRSFLAIEGEWCELECPAGRAPSPRRAVRVDLTTGRLIEVIATPADGRRVRSVTGGEHGFVYVTEGSHDTRVYLRWPGERRGTRVTGLPADALHLRAQP